MPSDPQSHAAISRDAAVQRAKRALDGYVMDTADTPLRVPLARDLLALLDELDTLAAALEECARISGADVSGGVPSWPPLHIWAVEEVRQLREDYDGAIS